MKLKNIFKILCSITAVAAVGLTIGLFVQLIPKSYANAKIFTKEAYLKWNKDRSKKIDYSNLPTSDYSISKIFDNPKDVNGGNFVFYLGSQSYAQTNLMLWGINKGFAETEGESPVYSNSLVTKVLDSFWGENAANLGLDTINLQFLNYIDIVDTKSINDAWNLKIKRATSGNFITDDVVMENGEPKKDEHGNWVYKIDPFKWGVGEGRDIVGVDVIKGVDNAFSPEYTNFNFEPDPTTYYEYRPNDKKDTEYEKIYYRNTPDVINFLNNYSFIESYLSTHYQNSSASKQGMLVCFRNLNPNNYENEVTNPFDIKVVSNIDSSQETLGRTLDSIISFYNPDYDPDSNNSDSSNSGNDSTGDNNSSNDQTQKKSTKIQQYSYKINKIFSNYDELYKNMSIINKDDKYEH